ncbi:unnamed protein product [Ceutorhynchus assimilis]|uniref:Uncharacterized protein n=1 Tax=Ceutorhynchus assimilis TaxID=467358 RepID=A0A9N9MTH2_9CUCU|nr:unnamed protein product [Ceutorhynchus assimilis]
MESKKQLTEKINRLIQEKSYKESEIEALINDVRGREKVKQLNDFLNRAHVIRKIIDRMKEETGAQFEERFVNISKSLDYMKKLLSNLKLHFQEKVLEQLPTLPALEVQSCTSNNAKNKDNMKETFAEIDQLSQFFLKTLT